MEEEFQRKKREQEMKKLQEEEQERLMKQMNEKQREQHRKQLKLQKQRQEKLTLEKKYLQTIDGEFALLLKNVFNSKTSAEISLSQWDLLPIQKRLFFKAMEFNNSIRNLQVVRNNLDDSNAEDLFVALLNNDYLKKLELDDNQITNKSLEFIQNMLQNNQGLLHLSLAGNKIFMNEDENDPQNLLEEFLQSLSQHKNLIYVNLSGTQIQDKHLDCLIEYLQKYYPTPFIDISFNPVTDIQKIRQVQQLLVQTKTDFEKQRRNEMVERQEMINQDERMRSINKLHQNKQELINDITKDALQKQEWREMLLREELERQEEEDKRLGNKLEKDAQFRATKKTKKKKSKK